MWVGEPRDLTLSDWNRMEDTRHFFAAQWRPPLPAVYESVRLRPGNSLKMVISSNLQPSPCALNAGLP
jgi:hypothetical protein